MELEIRDSGGWKKAGEVSLSGSESQGTEAPCQLEYDLDYVDEKTQLHQIRGNHAFSCKYEVGYAPFMTDTWPSFLLDLFPQGAALQYVLNHYRIADQPQNYWRILTTARLSPPGNIRVKALNEETGISGQHLGFDKTEVIDKGPEFLDYMVSNGAPVSGTTGAAGAAPKFLLREDRHGKFHADGALEDELTEQCWLVKFPRGNRHDARNREILKAEKAWYDIAKVAGLKTHRELIWEGDCLFVPRFDREINKDSITYFGMESFYSLVGSSGFGSRYRHKTYTDALFQYSDDKEEDLIEYLLRDILNISLGNTDNHGRNQSVIKKGNRVTLSPLYDFAPMRFDPEGIVRNTRWKNEESFLTEAIKIYQDNYNISSSLLINRINGLWHNLRSINLRDYDFNHKFIEHQENVIESVESQIVKLGALK